jgi:hypothetical protein
VAKDNDDLAQHFVYKVLLVPFADWQHVECLPTEFDHHLHDSVANLVRSVSKRDTTVRHSVAGFVEGETQSWIARNECAVRMVEEVVA